MASAKNRSVLDYENEESLRKALLMMPPPLDKKMSAGTGGKAASPPGGNSKRTVTGENGEPMSVAENLDWVLPSYDPDTTEAQSMKEELHRLLVLKSYLILDAEREASFDRITGMGSRIFDVPICLVSLVDLGRQWFMSNRGLGDVRETPRNHAFCAHAILDKSNNFIVPDATKDFRFNKNPLVTSSPHIRFYAGSPLISPEGYKLGTFCIISPTPRPDGLSDSEKQILKDLSDTIVHEMVTRRHKMVDQSGPSSQLIAYTAHDLLTPLSGVQLSLTLLKEDDQVQKRLGSQQLELLNTASNCSDLMIRICKTAMESLRQETTPGADNASVSTGVASTLTKMEELTKSLLMILDPTPKRVPLIISIKPQVPKAILCDDLKLFRAALNLLTSALARTRYGKVQLSIRVVPGTEPSKHEQDVLFEVEDTASDIAVELYPSLFQPSRPQDGELRMSLSSVSLLINSLDGNYGFRPRNADSDETVVQGRPSSGSIFWFRVPMVEVADNVLTKTTSLGQISVLHSTESLTALAPSRSGPLKMPIVPVGHISRKRASSSAIFRNRVSNSGFPYEVFATRNMQNSTFDNSPAQVRDKGASAAAFAQILNRTKTRRKDPPPPPPPVASEEASVVIRSSASSTNATSSVRQRKALVIEDTTVVRKTLARALTKLGYVTTQAVDGSEGLNALKNDLFDLTLCDFLMPVMDGMDCVKQYRVWESKHRPSLRLLIVGISAHANANDCDQGIKVGMDKFWPKPVTIKKITDFQEHPLALSSFSALDRDWEEKHGVASALPSDAANGRPVPLGGGGGPAAPIAPTLVVDISEEATIESPKSPQRTASWHAQQPTKRQRFDDSTLPTTQVCLIATDTPTRQQNDVMAVFEAKGWKVLVVHDGNDALRLLEIRNYDVVLLDARLPVIDAHTCMTKFRVWEDQNRVNRQKNTFLVCDADIPSPLEDLTSIVQPPSAFDGVLRKPVVWEQLEFLMNKRKRACLEIIQR